MEHTPKGSSEASLPKEHFKSKGMGEHSNIALVKNIVIENNYRVLVIKRNNLETWVNKKTILTKIEIIL